MAMQTIPEIAAHLSDLKNKEALAVNVEVSEGGKRIVIPNEDGTATFLIECAGFPNEGRFLVGYPSPTTEAGWPAPQVLNEARRLREPDKAITEAVRFMRRFKTS